MNRPTAICVGSVVVIGLAGAAWWLGASSQSPSEAAARATEPPSSVITAEVEYRMLAMTLVQRGEVRSASLADIEVPSSVTGRAVVTETHGEVGDRIDEGTPVAAISGRPVFVMEGAVPTYRALGPGDSGHDVRQLQAALERLGFTLEVNGSFDAETKRAVADFYQAAGYEPLQSSQVEESDLANAEQVLSDAEVDVQAARTELDEAGAGPIGSELASAQAARTDAERALKTLKEVGANELAFKQTELAASVAARDSLAADPATDPAALTQAQLQVDRLVLDLDTMRRTTTDQIAAANERLWIASIALDELDGADAVRIAERRLEAALRAQARAQAALDRLSSQVGPTIPVGEIVFLERMPARILSAASALVDGGMADSGANAGMATGPIMQLGSGNLFVTTVVRPEQRQLVSEGLSVQLLDEMTGKAVEGVVDDVAAEPTVDDNGDLGYAATVRPSRPLAAELLGRTLRVTITALSSEGDVLVVPLAAVSSDAAGRTRVSVVDASTHVQRDVEVRTGVSADGFVAVLPLSAGSLNAGDRVVVGR